MSSRVVFDQFVPTDALTSLCARVVARDGESPFLLISRLHGHDDTTFSINVPSKAEIDLLRKALDAAEQHLPK